MVCSIEHTHSILTLPSDTLLFSNCVSKTKQYVYADMCMLISVSYYFYKVLHRKTQVAHYCGSLLYMATHYREREGATDLGLPNEREGATDLGLPNEREGATDLGLPNEREGATDLGLPNEWETHHNTTTTLKLKVHTQPHRHRQTHTDTHAQRE